MEAARPRKIPTDELVPWCNDRNIESGARCQAAHHPRDVLVDPGGQPGRVADIDMGRDAECHQAGPTLLGKQRPVPPRHTVDERIGGNVGQRA